MEYHKKDFPEALRFLADRAGITLAERGASESRGNGPSRSDLRQVTARAASFFRKTLEHADRGKTARKILEQRGITPAAAEQFTIGYAQAGWENLTTRLATPALLRAADAVGLVKARETGQGHYDAFRNRLMFPICDEVGVPIAFGGRVVDRADEPKYLNSPESPVFNKSKTLYGFHLARTTIEASGTVIVTEGYTDVIACHQAGVSNVVGTLGTALTAEHASKLSRFCDHVVLLFDGDEAGQRAAERALQVFFSAPLDVSVCVLPGGIDPDELLRESDGRERFDQAIGQSVDAMDYVCGRFSGKLQAIESSAGRQKLLDAFLAELSRLGFSGLQGVRRGDTLHRLEAVTRIPAAQLDGMLRAHRPTSRPTPVVLAEPSDAPPMDHAEHGPGASRARRRAEYDVIALLIFEPELVHASFDGASMADRLREWTFLDDAARVIVNRVLERLGEGTALTVQDLHQDLRDDHARRVASDLYFDGQRRVSEAETTSDELLQHAVEALESHVDRDRYEERLRSARGTSTTMSLGDVQELLELRRQQEVVPAAIPQGVRG